jgi:hypothetical protein
LKKKLKNEYVQSVNKKRKPKVKEHIHIPYKYSSCSIKDVSFDVELFKHNLSIPSRTIPLTIDNINLITPQLIKGLGMKNKLSIIKHLDKINSIDDLLYFKNIGIGKRTIDKLKQYFHIDNILKYTPSVIDVLIDDNNIPIVELINDDYNLPIEESSIIVSLTKSIGKYCK